jgi:hypothetical protein
VAIGLIGVVYFIINSIMGMTSGVSEAKKTVDVVFSKLQAENYDEALNYYSEKFFEITPKDKFKKMLQTSNSKLGNIINYSVLNYNVKVYNYDTYITLVYKVNREKFYSKETIFLYKGGSDESFLIEGHNINSEGFLE